MNSPRSRGWRCGDDVSQDIFSVFHNMIFFLVLGLWSSFWVIRRRRPFPIPSRNFAPRCKKIWKPAQACAGITEGRPFRMRLGPTDTDRLPVICLGLWTLKNFLEARIGAKRVPLPTEAKLRQRDAAFECGQHSRGSYEQLLD